ncbi:MAG TPA: hypothetical protein VGL78_05655 [Solirubrobacteraceae bacterium]
MALRASVVSANLRMHHDIVVSPLSDGEQQPLFYSAKNASTWSYRQQNAEKDDQREPGSIRHAAC